VVLAAIKEALDQLIRNPSSSELSLPLGCHRVRRLFTPDTCKDDV
jgi:hypothetical protein